MSDSLPHSPISPEAIRQAARDRYPLRSPDAAEATWFASQPDVAGYAAPVPPGTQRQVVLNPLLSADSQQAVHANEGIRHFMYETGQSPSFGLTPSQRTLLAFYGNGAYAAHPEAARQTIVARMLSGDQSLAPYTSEQQVAARNIGVGLLRGLAK